MLAELSLPGLLVLFMLKRTPNGTGETLGMVVLLPTQSGDNQISFKQCCTVEEDLVILFSTEDTVKFDHIYLSGMQL